ncbi:hypothetical protein ACFL27_17155 [candidate division CSSED10-310 bacterium]|uniref:Uncharacterized protein n=1 Tax=candidate division CSSED10-310 bacterium TaxID=2855610 RepID=A0ABV6Z0S9_UNCC1
MKSGSSDCWIYLVLVTCCLLGNQVQARGDPLWEKATALTAENQGWIPGIICTRLEELDKHGNILDIDETWTQLSLGNNGEVKSELTKRVKNGKDVTHELKNEKQTAVVIESKDETQPEEQEENNSASVGMANPFEPEKQQEIKTTRTEKMQHILGKNCVVFEFQQKTSPENNLIGTAWLQEKTGIPVQIKYTLTPLPKFTKKMETTIQYEYISKKEWYPKQMTIKATAGLLFIKKNFRSIVQFSEHWQKEPAPKVD